MPNVYVRLDNSTYSMLSKYSYKMSLTPDQCAQSIIEKFFNADKKPKVKNYRFISPNATSIDFVEHLQYSFLDFGGNLVRSNNMFQNSKYIMYFMHTSRGTGVSPIVTYARDPLLKMERLANETGKVPLLAAYGVNSVTGEKVFGVFGLRAVPVMSGYKENRINTGSRANNGKGRRWVCVRYADSGKVYVHCKNMEDQLDILKLSRQTLPEGLFRAIYGV